MISNLENRRWSRSWSMKREEGTVGRFDANWRKGRDSLRDRSRVG